MLHLLGRTSFICLLNSFLCSWESAPFFDLWDKVAPKKKNIMSHIKIKKKTPWQYQDIDALT